MKNFNGLVNNIHRNAKEKGWWDQPRTPLEIHMLVVSEIAEATEQVRNGKPDYYANEENVLKPEGEAVELVDAVIRIMDYFGYKGWDFEQILANKVNFNKSRPYRHGGKKA